MTRTRSGWDSRTELSDEFYTRTGPRRKPLKVRVVTVYEQDRDRGDFGNPWKVTTRVYVEHGKPVPKWIRAPRTDDERAVIHWRLAMTVWDSPMARALAEVRHATVMRRAVRGHDYHLPAMPQTLREQHLDQLLANTDMNDRPYYYLPGERPRSLPQFVSIVGIRAGQERHSPLRLVLHRHHQRPCPRDVSWMCCYDLDTGRRI